MESTEIIAIARRRMMRDEMRKLVLPERKARMKRAMNGRVMRKKTPPMVN